MNGVQAVLYRQNLCFIILLSFMLTSCRVGPDFRMPEAPQVQEYSEVPLPETMDDEQVQSFRLGQDINAQWWELFQSTTLNQLVETGLKNNLTLQAAQASLQQAIENLNAGTGVLYPTIDMGLNTSRQQVSQAVSGVERPVSRYNLYNASVNVSYPLDIFGKFQREVEILHAGVDQQRFELEAAYLTLTSTIVTTAIAAASIADQIQATQELIALQEKQLEIIHSQFRLGGASQIDILAQESLVAKTKTTLPPLEQQLMQARHALSMLIGDFPSKTQLPYFTLKEINLPADLPLTLPSSLVQQRPDIKAAEALLHQANAQVGVAQANLFPQLTLTGDAGSAANTIKTLFVSSTNVWRLGAQLFQPIFHGGSLVAQENAAIANYEKVYAQYRQTVLQAFQNVADVLYALVSDAKSVQTQRVAEKAAHTSLKLAQKQYQLGAVNFMAVLDAERLYQQARLAKIQAEAMRYADTAALFQALGGGWWNRIKGQPL